MESRNYAKEKEGREAVSDVPGWTQREEMVEQNLGLIHMVLKRFAGRGYEMEDLFQIGAVGLIKAVDRFDPALGYSFSTYAVPVIIGEIRRFLRDDGLVHVSRKIKEDRRLVAKSAEQIRSAALREPTLSELSEQTGLSREEIVLAMESGYEVKSLFAPAGGEAGQTGGQELLLQDKVEDERCSQEQVLEVLVLKQVLDKLEEEEKRLIAYRYLQGKTQQQTAELMQINQVAVSRKEKKALQKLRLYMKE